ncbi:hypothetical protein [Bacillus fungorum]|uniref:hypothetical protein n=1 Tax=Bacillus fungorum TaxID=2039284 RepID=UPI0015F2D6C9
MKRPQRGEAQVDFGNMTAVQDGAYKDIKALILSFPHNNAAFVYPLPAERRFKAIISPSRRRSYTCKNG